MRKLNNSRNFAIDLFCGAGGMTCGLIQAGFHVIAGVDKENRCKETYIQNVNHDGSHSKFLNFDLFPSDEFHPDGQQSIAINELMTILKEVNFSRENGDRLLIAVCAPCQPFTKISQIKLTNQRAF